MCSTFQTVRLYSVIALDLTILMLITRTTILDVGYVHTSVFVYSYTLQSLFYEKRCLKCFYVHFVLICNYTED